MTEPKFKVKITGVEFSIELMNKEAETLYQEFNLVNVSFLKFILLSPNTMDLDKDGSLIYEVDPSYKEEVIKELKDINGIE